MPPKDQGRWGQRPSREKCALETTGRYRIVQLNVHAAFA